MDEFYPDLEADLEANLEAEQSAVIDDPPTGEPAAAAEEEKVEEEASAEPEAKEPVASTPKVSLEVQRPARESKTLNFFFKPVTGEATPGNADSLFARPACPGKRLRPCGAFQPAPKKVKS